MFQIRHFINIPSAAFMFSMSKVSNRMLPGQIPFWFLKIPRLIL